jgi:hypothetical protein
LEQVELAFVRYSSGYSTRCRANGCAASNRTTCNSSQTGTCCGASACAGHGTFAGCRATGCKGQRASNHHRHADVTGDRVFSSAYGHENFLPCSTRIVSQRSSVSELTVKYEHKY